MAETELGLTYEEIDSILHCIIDKNLRVEETSKVTEIPISDVDKIYRMYKKSEHKRSMAKPCIL